MNHNHEEQLLIRDALSDKVVELRKEKERREKERDKPVTEVFLKRLAQYEELLSAYKQACHNG